MYALQILVASPDESLLSKIRSHLFAEGFDVALARDAGECMQLLDTFEPDMVVVDPDLPGNGGEIVLAALSNEDLAHRTPVILLVSQTRHAALYNSGRFTIHDFLLQPLSPARLVLRIRYLASCGSRSPARTRPRYAEAAARNEDLLLTNV